MKANKKQIYWFIIGVIVLAALIGFVRERFLTTDVVLHDPEVGAMVVIDGKQRHEVVEGDTELVFSVSAGAHEIGLMKEGFWVWVKRVHTDKSATLELFPFMLRKDNEPEGIKESNDAYERVLARFSEPPTERAVSDDGMSTIYTATTTKTDDVKSIFIAWEDKASIPSYFCDPECVEALEITRVGTGIRNMAFFPGRNDVVIFATANGVFAIEADSRGTHNFQSLYKGEAPDVRRDGNTVYVKDGDRLLSFSL